jgi:superfamily I DNA and/or RNA helicase
LGGSPNDQKDLLRVALDAYGLGGVVVETANKLQGLEFEVVFVWHPLAGLPEADAFHLDPGRLCVLLTRHRQACIVVGPAGDCDLLKDRVPPPTEAYLGWDPDPVLDGWEVHRQVFAALEPFRIGS